MSHFNLAVFTPSEDPDLAAILDPFYEGNEVEQYISQTKSELIAEERQRMQRTFETRYAEWQKDPAAYEKAANPSHIEYLKKLPERMKRSAEEIYQEAIADYEEDSIDADGNILSTYNPHSKWDWYEVGGRWQGLLLLKPSKTGRRGTPGLMTPMSENYDAAYVKDIDFERMRALQIAALRPYEEAMTKSFYKEEYMRQCYPTEVEYIERNSGFHTYAVLTPDGEWHAPGEMGWFGISTDTPTEGQTWESGYYDRFIKPAITNGWYMTIVDCHI